MPRNTPTSTRIGVSDDDNTSTVPCGVVYGRKAGTSVCLAGWFSQDQKAKLSAEAKKAGYHVLLLQGRPQLIAGLDLRPVSLNWRGKLQIDAVPPATFATLEALAAQREEFGADVAISGADQESVPVEQSDAPHHVSQLPDQNDVLDCPGDAADLPPASLAAGSEASELRQEMPSSGGSAMAPADPVEQDVSVVETSESVTVQEMDVRAWRIFGPDGDNNASSGDHAEPSVGDMHADDPAAPLPEARETSLGAIDAETPPVAPTLVERSDASQPEPGLATDGTEASPPSEQDLSPPSKAFRFKLDVPLEIGLVVLAPQEAENNGDEGWYEAIVKDIRTDGIELIWRDYPKELPFVRQHEHVALMIRPDLFPPPPPKVPKRGKGAAVASTKVSSPPKTA